MQTDVKSAYQTSTGTTYAARTRVRGALVTGTGTVIYKDGGSGGTTLLTVNNTGTTSVLIPGAGVLFGTDVHATISGVTAVTTFYG